MIPLALACRRQARMLTLPEMDSMHAANAFVTAASSTETLSRREAQVVG